MKYSYETGFHKFDIETMQFDIETDRFTYDVSLKLAT